MHHTKTNKTSWWYWFLSAHLRSEESSQPDEFVLKLIDIVHPSLRVLHVAEVLRILLS